MALQDNLNATLNKQQQKQQEREEKKLNDKIAEYKIKELLEKSIKVKIEQLENKTSIFNNSIKEELTKDLIDDIANGSILFYKNSTYYNPKNIKYFILSNYEKTAKKCLQFCRMKEKEEEQQKKEAEKITISKNTIEQKNDVFKKIMFVLCLPFLIVGGLLIGFISAVCKNIK